MPTVITGTDGINQVQAGAVESGDLAAGAIGSGDLPAGSVIQVVSTTKTDVFSVINPTSFVNITGLSVNITPTSSSSNVLVQVLVQSSATLPGGNPEELQFRITKNSIPVFLGDSSGNRTSATFAIQAADNFAPANSTFPFAGQFFDSPNTTNQLTYQVQGFCGSELYVNRSRNDFDTSLFSRTISNITVMEIAG